MRGLNTFGFESIAERYAEAKSEGELLELLEAADVSGWPLLLLGGGSNVVLTGDVPGLVLRFVADRVTYDEPDEHGRVQVRVEGGKCWDTLVDETLACGLGGLENLTAIPGSVGAAPVQNIGAYGVELAERVTHVRAWHRPTRDWIEMTGAECGFGYRDSRFKRERGDWVITAVTFELGPHHPVVANYPSLAAELAARGVSEPDARAVRDAVAAVRRARLPDPAKIGNVGSFFHNPVVSRRRADALLARFPDLVHYPLTDGRVKIAAGWLVERCGFRGHREGGVGVHERQALVLVHEGGADGAALLALVTRIRVAVEERYGIELEVEPLLV